MPSETDRAIERIRQDAPPWGAEDVRTLLTEYDRIKAELARLATLQTTPKIGGEKVLIWRSGEPFCIERTVLTGEMWTPLPTPKEASHEPQE